jgi:hypothetical protein
MRWVVLISVVSLSVPGCNGEKSTAASRRITWTEAQRLLTECRVEAVEQSHRRLVTLKLRDGTTAFTHEPRIDDMFRTLRRLPPSCAPHTVATE